MLESIRRSRNIAMHSLYLLLCLVFLLLFFYIKADAAEPGDEMGDILLNPAEEIDPNMLVDITINLEDESRFLGVSLYRICEYADGRFDYIETYRGLDITPYYKMSREADILSVAQTISEYIKEEDIQPDARMVCQNGVLTAEGLPIGVYLVLQNEEDFNASLDRVYVIQAPTWSDETEEYLYDIRSFPKWNREVWFSFRPEVVYPTVAVVGLVLSLGLCIFGPSLFRVVFFVAVCIMTGILGVHLGESIDSSFVGMMVFFVTFAFLGLAAIMMLNMLLSPVSKKLKIHRLTQRHQFWMAPLAGAIAFSAIAYFYFSFHVIVCAVTFVVLAALGITLQAIKKKKGKQIQFYTYDDLIEENKREKEA